MFTCIIKTKCCHHYKLWHTIEILEYNTIHLTVKKWNIRSLDRQNSLICLNIDAVEINYTKYTVFDKIQWFLISSSQKCNVQYLDNLKIVGTTSNYWRFYYITDEIRTYIAPSVCKGVLEILSLLLSQDSFKRSLM